MKLVLSCFFGSTCVCVCIDVDVCSGIDTIVEVAVAWVGMFCFKSRCLLQCVHCHGMKQNIYTHTQVRRHNFVNCIIKELVMSVSAWLYVGAAHKDAQAEDKN